MIFGVFDFLFVFWAVFYLGLCFLLVFAAFYVECCFLGCVLVFCLVCSFVCDLLCFLSLLTFGCVGLPPPPPTPPPPPPTLLFFVFEGILFSLIMVPASMPRATKPRSQPPSLLCDCPLFLVFSCRGICSSSVLVIGICRCRVWCWDIG